MCLHAVDRDGRVGGGSVGVEVHARAGLQLAELDRVHGGADGCADRLLGDAVLGQHMPLAPGRGAAVAAHRRHDEGFAARRAYNLGDRADDQRDVGDAATAGGDRHRLPVCQAAPKIDALELGADGGGDVVEAILRQVLSGGEEARQGPGGVVRHAPFECIGAASRAVSLAIAVSSSAGTGGSRGRPVELGGGCEDAFVAEVEEGALNCRVGLCDTALTVRVTLAAFCDTALTVHVTVQRGAVTVRVTLPEYAEGGGGGAAGRMRWLRRRGGDGEGEF